MLPARPNPEGFDFVVRGEQVAIRHHGRKATTLRGQRPSLPRRRLVGRPSETDGRAHRQLPGGNDSHARTTRAISAAESFSSRVPARRVSGELHVAASKGSFGWAAWTALIAQLAVRRSCSDGVLRRRPVQRRRRRTGQGHPPFGSPHGMSPGRPSLHHAHLFRRRRTSGQDGLARAGIARDLPLEAVQDVVGVASGP